MSVRLQSQLSDFVRFCEESTGRAFADHAAFHDFSVAEFRRFWALFLRWVGIAAEGAAEPVCTSEECEHALFFPDLRLSYPENLLRIDSAEDGARTAVVAIHAGRETQRLSRRELQDRVRRTAGGLAQLGVSAGDCVVAVAGNNLETLIGCLATLTLGATFSSAGPEMGTQALLSRFEQLHPRLLMANLAAGDQGSASPAAPIEDLLAGLPSISGVVGLDQGPLPGGGSIRALRLAELAEGPLLDPTGQWPRFPFNHPLFVLFTSGTTGRPKCLVHGAGGTLLEHLKEHRLHVDLGSADKLFFQTSAAWMMWNWQLTALASGAAVVLYDGPLTSTDLLWRIVADEQVTVFGTSPPYLRLCEDVGFSPAWELSLPKLRSVLSTGSILHDSQYDWVAERVGPVALQSISGGTDIIGCFVLGNPDLPVVRGQIQCRSLGLDVQSIPAVSKVGELVCRNPFPSRPLGLIGDDGGERFHAAYFEANPGMWTHGDLIEIMDDGQVRMHGRSDGVLHANGIRIGPAEIYRALQDVREIREAMAVEQRTPDGSSDSRIVLFVVPRVPGALDGRLQVHIRRTIAQNASPAHVPELLVEVSALPVTHSGKPSESAARDVANGQPVANLEALRNPSVLDQLGRALQRAEHHPDQPPAVVQAADGSSTEARLIAIWELVLGVAPLLASDNFFDMGGTSLAAVRLFSLIQEQMRVELPLSTILEAPTPAAMAKVLDGVEAREFSPLVLLRDGGAGRPVFIAHPLAGEALGLRPLALELDTDGPVYGLQAVGIDPHQEPQTRVEDMAATYVDAIRSVQERGPYAFAGYSFGALLAFEMARQLRAAGERTDWLFLIEADLHRDCLSRPERLRFACTLPFRYLQSALANPGVMVPRYLRLAALRIAPRAPITPPPPEWEVPPQLRRLEEAGLRAFEAYRPQAYAGNATFFMTGNRRPGQCDPMPVWRQVIEGRIAVEPVPGSHMTVVLEPNLSALAALMGAHLAEQHAIRR